MRNTAFSGVAPVRLRGIFASLTCLLFAVCVLAFLFTGSLAFAQDKKDAAVLPAPSAGKAIVCIYRVGRFVGSAAHDELYINDIHLAELLNGEYAFMEVPPGTVVIAGLPKMYYGSAIMSAGAALAETRKKENERARFEAEAGKTYYYKWTSGTMATGIKVTAEDPAVGAKEMSKLHISKPPVEKEGDQKKIEEAHQPKTN
ncbi:MAG: DUF2846 domain-containing protein [Terracidiphilus sp.]